MSLDYTNFTGPVEIQIKTRLHAFPKRTVLIEGPDNNSMTPSLIGKGRYVGMLSVLRMSSDKELNVIAICRELSFFQTLLKYFIPSQIWTEQAFNSCWICVLTSKAWLRLEKFFLSNTMHCSSIWTLVNAYTKRILYYTGRKALSISLPVWV